MKGAPPVSARLLPRVTDRCLPRLISGREDGGFTLYTEGDRLYEAMLASIAAARASIRLETYILAGDEVGWRFAAALTDKVAQGVEVRVIVDAAGAMLWGAGALVSHMQSRGVQVQLFHRWLWRTPLRYNRRDHRKMLIIDDREFYLGGYNIHRENSRDAVGERRWRDTHVRVGGTLAADGAMLFDIFWDRRPHWVARRGPVVSALVPNHNHLCRHTMRHLYTDCFDGAHHSIYLTTPYFVPDRRIQHGLQAAARRGIDVRLLLPGKTDVWLVQWASQAAYAELLAAGVRIFEYMPRVLHAKAAVVDGEWAALGTANLDYRSFFLNYELMLVSRDTRLCDELQERFMSDLEQTQEISAAKWAKRAWSRHLSESIGWLARRWL